MLQTVPEDASHGGYIAGGIGVTYTDGGDGTVPRLTTAAQVTVRQQKQEVEFVVSQTGTNTSATADVGGGLQRGSLGNGDWLLLNGPFDLQGVDTLTVRHSGGPVGGVAGSMEVRLDAVDGPLLTTVTVPGTASATTYASTTVPVVDPGGAHQVYLVFRPVAGGPTNNFFNLNYGRVGRHRGRRPVRPVRPEHLTQPEHPRRPCAVSLRGGGARLRPGRAAGLSPPRRAAPAAARPRRPVGDEPAAGQRLGLARVARGEDLAEAGDALGRARSGCRRRTTARPRCTARW